MRPLYVLTGSTFLFPQWTNLLVIELSLSRNRFRDDDVHPTYELSFGSLQLLLEVELVNDAKELNAKWMDR